MIHRFLVLVCIFQLFLFSTYAQTNELPAISFHDFDISNSPVIDSTTHAVVILEKGCSDIQVDEKSKVLKDYFLLNGRRFDCSKLTYIMKDIPAFHEESYMLAPKNYKSAINFELMQYYSTNGARQNLTKEWKDVDRELLNNRSFGGEIDRENNFKHILPEIYGNEDSEEEKARKIYAYIKKQIKWNKVYG